MVVPYDSYQLSLTPYIESINPVCISLAKCPALLAIEEKMGRMQVLYSFSLVEMEILEFQIWLSRLCIAS